MPRLVDEWCARGEPSGFLPLTNTPQSPCAICAGALWCTRRGSNPESTASEAVMLSNYTTSTYSISVIFRRLRRTSPYGLVPRLVSNRAPEKDLRSKDFLGRGDATERSCPCRLREGLKAKFAPTSARGAEAVMLSNYTTSTCSVSVFAAKERLLHCAAKIIIPQPREKCFIFSHGYGKIKKIFSEGRHGKDRRRRHERGSG